MVIILLMIILLACHCVWIVVKRGDIFYNSDYDNNNLMMIILRSGLSLIVLGLKLRDNIFIIVIMIIVI